MGLGRKLERNKLKDDYRKFCQTWNLARKLESDLGRQYRELKRPSFKEWLTRVEAMKNRRSAQPAAVEENLEWDE